jgi:hypothetical protein
VYALSIQTKLNGIAQTRYLNAVPLIWIDQNIGMADTKKTAEDKNQPFLSFLNVPIKSIGTSFLSFVEISLQNSPSISIIPPMTNAKRVDAVLRKEGVSAPTTGLWSKLNKNGSIETKNRSKTLDNVVLRLSNGSTDIIRVLRSHVENENIEAERKSSNIPVNFSARVRRIPYKSDSANW